MVNSAVTDAGDAARALAIGYAPAGARAGLAALLALDGVLGGVLRSTREPLLGQIRLTWWHDALLALDQRPPPAEPVLTALAAQVLPHGVTGAMLAATVDGWEALLADPVDGEAIRRFGEGRGGGLFRSAAALLGAGDAGIGAAGEGWALADLARHLTDARAAGDARTRATACLQAAFAQRWSRPARPLGALALLARADLQGVPAASPRRVALLLRHRLTGR